MKTILLIATGILLTTPANACFDPVLKTNTDPHVLSEVYRRAWEALKKTHARSAAKEAKGAAILNAQQSGCSFYSKLLSESEIPCLAPLVRAYNELPNQTRFVPTTRDGKEVKLAVHLVGDGRHEQLLIFIPGVMADHSEYRYVVGALGGNFDFWLVDPPGCGASEAPDPETLGPGGYSPESLAERDLQAIEVLLAETGTSAHVQVVAHSLGGLVTLRAFSDPELRLKYERVIKRMEGLILISPCDVFMTQVNPTLISRTRLNGFAVALGQGLGVVQEKVARYLAGSFYASHCLAREEVDRAVYVLTNPGTRTAFQAMLREALPFDPETGAPKFDPMNQLEAQYANVDLPVRILWGKCDQTLPVSMGYMLKDQPPNARLTVIGDCKHAPNLECPAKCAALIAAYQDLAAERTSPKSSLAQIDNRARHEALWPPERSAARN